MAFAAAAEGRLKKEGSDCVDVVYDTPFQCVSLNLRDASVYGFRAGRRPLYIACGAVLIGARCK